MLYNKKVELCAFEVIDKCNLFCNFCIRNATKNLKGVINSSTLKKRLDIISRQGELSHIALTGGEPFLHPSILTLAHIARAYASKVSITTNATVVKESLIKEFSKINNLHFIISLDGPPQIHAKVRGFNNAYTQLESFIELLHKYNIPFLINMTVSDENYLYVEDTISLAHKFGSRDIGISLVKPEGRGADVSLITNKHLLHACYSILKAKKIFDSPSFKIKFFDPLAHIFLPDHPITLCGASKNILHIQTNGLVRICTSCDQNLGNIEDSNYNIIEKINQDVYLEKINNREFNGNGCAKCEFKEACGGCRCRSKNINGDFLGIDPLCSKSFLKNLDYLTINKFGLDSLSNTHFKLIEEKYNTEVINENITIQSIEKADLTNNNYSSYSNATVLSLECNPSNLSNLKRLSEILIRFYKNAKFLYLKITRAERTQNDDFLILDILFSEGFDPELIDFDKKNNLFFTIPLQDLNLYN